MEFKTLRNGYWLTCVLAIAFHQWVQHGLGISIPFADNYLDAWLSIPVLLGLMLQERQVLGDTLLPQQQFANYRFSILEVVIATVLLAIIFEELLPVYCAAYIRDPWDYVAYGFGALIFLLLINRKEA